MTKEKQIHSVSFPGFIFTFIAVFFFSSGHHIIYLLVIVSMSH